MNLPPLHAPAALWGAGISLALPATALLGALLGLVRANDELSRGDRPPSAAGAGAGHGPAVLTGVLLGIGIAGFVDEALFHQILQWHNFYWNTDDRGRLLSDGLFHVFSNLVLLWGVYRLWRGARPAPRVLLGGILLGAGGFNAYDGIVQHVLLHLHLVNEHVCPSPYDGGNSVATCRQDIPYEIAWIAAGLAVAAAGLVLMRSTPEMGVE